MRLFLYQQYTKCQNTREVCDTCFLLAVAVLRRNFETSKREQTEALLRHDFCSESLPMNKLVDSLCYLLCRRWLRVCWVLYVAKGRRVMLLCDACVCVGGSSRHTYEHLRRTHSGTSQYQFFRGLHIDRRRQLLHPEPEHWELFRRHKSQLRCAHKC